MPMNPRLLRPILSGDPDALRYIAAVQKADGNTLELAVRKAITDFVVGCKQDGIWSAIKASCILMGARTLSGALTPLVGEAPTNSNFVSGDYSRTTGLAGNGVNKSLNSNRNNNADPQNSKSFSVYISNAGADGGVVRAVIYSGFSGTAGATGFGFRNSDGVSNFNNNNATADAPTIANPVGLVGASRSASANYVARFAGGNNTYTRTSETPNNANITLYQTGGARFSGVRLAFYHIGESLDLASLDTRVSALYTAIGAAI